MCVALETTAWEDGQQCLACEVGRSLSHAPKADNVARTVLRRSEFGDIGFVGKSLLKSR